jgi:hypothetical protein
MSDTVVAPPVLALRETVAVMAAWALWEGAEDRSGCGGGERDSAPGTPGQRRCRERGEWSWQESGHAGVEALGGLFLPFVGAVEGDPRDVALGVAEVALDEPGGHAGCEQRGGGRRAAGMEGHPCCGDAGAVCGGAAGALDAGPTPGGGRRRTVFVTRPVAGKRPGWCRGVVQ